MSVLQAVGQRVFSFCVWSVGFAWMFVGASLTLVLLVVGFPYQRVHLWVTAPLFAQCLRIATVRLRVHYHPDFDPNRRSVFTQNHINLLDGHLASAVIAHAFSGVMNAWQFHIPIYGWLMRMSKGIGVHRSRRDKMLEELSLAARERKRIGMSILTFPEGHRTRNGRIGPFRRGVFLMARNAEMPIVPIAVRGMYDVNHKGTWLFEAFRQVDVFVGPQHETAGLDDAAIAALTLRVQATMGEALEIGRFPDAWSEPNALPSRSSSAAM